MKLPAMKAKKKLSLKRTHQLRKRLYNAAHELQNVFVELRDAEAAEVYPSRSTKDFVRLACDCAFSGVENLDVDILRAEDHEHALRRGR